MLLVGVTQEKGARHAGDGTYASARSSRS